MRESSDSDATEIARQTVALLSEVFDSETLALAAYRLVSALAADGAFDRVSLGLWENDRVQLIASSDHNFLLQAHELKSLVEGAMEEALEQAGSLIYPLREPAGLPILVEHQLLTRQTNAALATIPLGQNGQRVAALCFERSIDRAFVSDEVLVLERVLTLAAPALRCLQMAESPWYRRLWRELCQSGAALRLPAQRNRRRMLALLTLAVALLALLPVEDRVAGRARLEGFEQRTISAPTDSFIAVAHVRPGDRVEAGAPLVDLLEADLQLERESWSSQLTQHENAYAAAMVRADRVAAATSIARVGEAQAQLSLVDEQLMRARIAAPFAAQVIQGDLSQLIGAPVHQGDTLLTLASIDRFRVIVEVDEVDIARIALGQSGQLALSSLPWENYDLLVTRIVPMAKAVEGRNVFEVEADLPEPPAELRPGLLGRAHITTGRTPLLWSWTRHMLLRLRVVLWSWLG
ncbi:MAG: HlyD family efflux transporter periplasmic adaptor subunit [Propionivibrio sp.]